MEEFSEDFFTVVIPTLNEEKHLPRLLDDLKKQTFKNFSVIIVDGRSEDKTRDIAKKYNVQVLISQKRNVSYQRNMGAKSAKSAWIVFMDADDRITKTYLKKVQSYISKNDPDILSTWLMTNSRLTKDKLTATIMNLFMDINKNSKKPFVMESMVFIKRDVFHKLGGFNVNIAWREGEELLQKAKQIGFNFDFINTPKYTYSFRRLKKVGAFKMLQEMSQMEVIKALKGGLTIKDTKMFYPMNGGGFYKSQNKKKLSLKKFISILFE